MAYGGFPLEYWLQWQVFLSAIIFILPTIISIKFILTKNQQTHNIGYDHLWMPCWKNLHPLWLLVFRLFSFVSMAWLLYQTVMSFGLFVFYFYTQWTFLLVTIYFALGTIISAHGCWMHTKEHGPPNQERDKFLKKDSSPKVNEASQHNHTQVNQEAGFWGNLMQNLYQTCAGAVVLTDIVFWCLLLPFQTGDNFKLTLLIGCMHSVNAVFLLLDSAINSLQFSWFGLTYFVLWSSTYIVFQWVMHACCFKWYFGIALFHLPCYGLFVWLVKAKVSLFSKMFPRAFTRMVANEKQM